MHCLNKFIFVIFCEYGKNLSSFAQLCKKWNRVYKEEYFDKHFDFILYNLLTEIPSNSQLIMGQNNRLQMLKEMNSSFTKSYEQLHTVIKYERYMTMNDIYASFQLLSPINMNEQGYTYKDNRVNVGVCSSCKKLKAIRSINKHNLCKEHISFLDPIFFEHCVFYEFEQSLITYIEKKTQDCNYGKHPRAALRDKFYNGFKIWKFMVVSCRHLLFTALDKDLNIVQNIFKEVILQGGFRRHTNTSMLTMWIETAIQKKDKHSIRDFIVDILIENDEKSVGIHNFQDCLNLCFIIKKLFSIIPTLIIDSHSLLIRDMNDYLQISDMIFFQDIDHILNEEEEINIANWLQKYYSISYDLEGHGIQYYFQRVLSNQMFLLDMCLLKETCQYTQHMKSSYTAFGPELLGEIKDFFDI